MSEIPAVAGLGRLAAGAELANALARLSLGELDLADRLDVAVAQARQLAHDQAELWETLASIVDDDGGTVFTQIDDEVRLALSWTRTTTSHQLGTAVSLRDRLPHVLQAVREGRIHARVAEVIDTGTSHLPVAEAREVEARILADIAHASEGCDGIGGLTTGQVRDRVNRLCHQVDPQAATRRYQEALSERRIEGWCEPEGTANLAGRHLPLDQAALAKDRLDTISTAIIAAGASEGRTQAQVRADVFLGLLTGQITAPTDLTPDRTAAATDITSAAAAPAASAIDPGSAATTAPSATATDITPAVAAPAASAIDPGSAATTAPSATATAATAATTTAAVAVAARAAQRSGGVELVISAETLTGLASQPGHISGWGPIAAEIARQLADQLREAPWRWTVTDPATGQAIGHGVLRRRPDAGTDSFVRCRDRTCRHPCCRAPAHTTDVDHTIPFAEGGPATDDNLGALCRHDHRLKHSTGWSLTQPTPGVFEWTTPSGHHYRTHPNRLTDPTPPHQLQWAPDWRQLLQNHISQVELAA